MWVLADYKTSIKFQYLIYSYIHVFSKYSGYDIETPKHITLNKNVSVRDSNEKIVQLLRITPIQVELLDLETLRLDYEKRRKQRYRKTTLRAKTQDAHLQKQKKQV